MPIVEVKMEGEHILSGGNEEFCFRHVTFYSLLDIWLKMSSRQSEVPGVQGRRWLEIEIVETANVGDISSHETS